MFAKPKAVKLLDGSPISNLLTAPTIVKPSTTANTKPGTTTGVAGKTTTSKTVPGVGTKKPA